MDELDEILFKKKNKAYGAYILRKKYNVNVCIGLFISSVIVASVSVYAYVKSINITNDNLNYELQQEIVDYEQFNMLKNIDSLQVKEPPIKKKVVRSEEKKIVVVDTIKPETDTLRVVKLPDEKIDSLKNDSLAYSDTARAGSANGTEFGSIYTKVDELPQFPGGDQALSQYLHQNTHYPEEARKKNISGIVQIEFVIKKNGDIDKIAIKKSVNKLLDAEAIRVVKSFPKWKPGKRKGNAVNVLLVLPFKYML